jgi:hypothetical protein
MPARLRVVDPAAPDPGVIAEAAEVLVAGGLVAFPPRPSTASAPTP